MCVLYYCEYPGTWRRGYTTTKQTWGVVVHVVGEGRRLAEPVPLRPQQETGERDLLPLPEHPLLGRLGPYHLMGEGGQGRPTAAPTQTQRGQVAGPACAQEGLLLHEPSK